MKTLPTQNHWVRALVASGNFLYSGSYQAVKVWLSLCHLCVLVLTRRVCPDMELGEPGSSSRSAVQRRQCVLAGCFQHSHHLWDIREHDTCELSHDYHVMSIVTSVSHCSCGM